MTDTIVTSLAADRARTVASLALSLAQGIEHSTELPPLISSSRFEALASQAVALAAICRDLSRDLTYCSCAATQ